MLLLERTNRTAILIGDNVRIEIVHTCSNRVLIGIDAPRSVRIRRAELAPLDEAGATSATPKLGVAAAHA